MAWPILCLLLLCVHLLLVPLADASFCGKSGVPYSLEVLPSGAPVLGCAQPSCVISAPTADADDGDGQQFEEDSQFLTDAGGQSDGFFRDGDRALKRYRHQTAPKLIANCSGQFNELSCPRRNQWVGGIEYIDHPRQPLILQCCSFEGLRFSQEVGSTSIGPGEAITGGEVVRGGRQISFDVIANVKKVVKSENSVGGKVSYEVTVRRMNCLPDPPEPEVEIEADVPAEVAKVLSSAKNKELAAEKSNKQPAIKKPTAPHKQRQKAAAAKQQQLQAAPTRTEQLPEISGGEGERPAAIELQQPTHPQQQQNSEVAIQPAVQLVRQPSQGQRIQQQPIAQQPIAQQQFIAAAQQEFQGQQQQGISQLPAGGQQQQQLVRQQPTGEQQGQQQFVGQASGQATSHHPLFGELMPVHSFPTLPPHTFPTLPPYSFPPLPTHSFPTLAPHSFPTLPPHTFPTLPPHTFPTLPAGIFGTTPAPGPALGFAPTGQAGTFPAAAAFAAPSASGGGNNQPSAASSGGTFFPQQQSGGQSFQRSQQNALPIAGHQQQAPARMAPAMGTILAAMQGERYPVMHPVLGLIGYSNSPQPGQRVGRKK